MSARLDTLFTVDDLELMPEDGNRYEVIDGELYVSRAPGIPHQRVTSNAVFIFMSYLEKNPIGEIIPTPGLVFDRYDSVIPDLVFYTYERAREIISNDRLNAAPELVIEILSRGTANVFRDRVAKLKQYAKYGVEEYWIVDGEDRAVEIYRLQKSNLELIGSYRDEDEISTPLLPGLTFIASDLFR